MNKTKGKHPPEHAQMEELQPSVRALKATLRSMGPAVGTALIATVLGFGALYISPVPMVEDFGKMLTIGVVVSFLTSMIILTAILFVRDRFFPTFKPRGRRRGPSSRSERVGVLERLLETNTKAVLKLRVVILVIAIALTAAGLSVDHRIGVATDVETFMPQSSTALTQIHELRSVLGSTDQVSLLVSSDNVLNPTTLDWIDTTTQGVKSQFSNVVTDTQSVTSVMRLINNNQVYGSEKDAQKFVSGLPSSERKLLIHDDLKQTVILVSIKHLDATPLNTFLQKLQQYVSHPPTGVHVTVTGKPVVDAAMISGLTSGREQMTLLGMGLVFLGLLIIYRNPIKALIPIFPIGLIVGWSSGAMYLLGMKYTPLTATMGALIIGIGTEFTILLMERYFEERRHGSDERESMLVATRKIGKAILASGLTVIGGFSALIASNFPILHDFGVLTLIDMTLALFSTLVVLPPFIIFVDRWFHVGIKTGVHVKPAQ